MNSKEWVQNFVQWCNEEHLHSGIGFVTPATRHAGDDVRVLEKRKRVYELAQMQTPNRWKVLSRKWALIQFDSLNPNSKSESHSKAG
jgi:putative transposase